MNTLFSLLLILFLAVLQTVVLPCLPFFDHCFDLLIIGVLFLSLMAAHWSMVLIIGLIGLLMDSISGVPVFFHVFSYVSIYLMVHALKRLIFIQSLVFIWITGFLAMLVQQALLFFSVFVRQGIDPVGGIDLSLALQQIVWGTILIPPAVVMVQLIWEQWISVSRSVRRQVIQKYRD